MRIDIGDGFHLTEVREGDQSAYVESFRDKEITNFMILIPYPYTQEHADFWVRHCLGMSRQQPHPSEFAIRRPDGFLVGGIGLLLATDGRRRHRGELGYWLTKPYRGQGVMSRAVKAIVDYGFETLRLKRIEATAFTQNSASQRVLERAGLKREGTLSGWHCKDEKLMDAVMFAIVAPPPVG